MGWSKQRRMFVSSKEICGYPSSLSLSIWTFFSATISQWFCFWLCKRHHNCLHLFCLMYQTHLVIYTSTSLVLLRFSLNGCSRFRYISIQHFYSNGYHHNFLPRLSPCRICYRLLFHHPHVFLKIYYGCYQCRNNPKTVSTRKKKLTACKKRNLSIISKVMHLYRVLTIHEYFVLFCRLLYCKFNTDNSSPGSAPRPKLHNAITQLVYTTIKQNTAERTNNSTIVYLMLERD